MEYFLILYRLRPVCPRVKIAAILDMLGGRVRLFSSCKLIMHASVTGHGFGYRLILLR